MYEKSQNKKKVNLVRQLCLVIWLTLLGALEEAFHSLSGQRSHVGEKKKKRR